MSKTQTAVPIKMTMVMTSINNQEWSPLSSFRASIHRELDASAIRQLVEIGLKAKSK
jgi:hypothetical protein